MNIDNMPAGREMDAVVAQEIMGWQSWNTEQGPCYKDAEGKYMRGAHTWSPSVDIAAAWEVVEKLVISGHAVKMESIIAGPGMWSVTTYDASYVPKIKSADTAPLAICRAALKTVGL